MAGRSWVQGFSRRNPMIASRKAQSLSARRAQKLKRFIVVGHFSKLTTTLEEPGLMDKPERVYNVDDKGRRSYLHKHPLLLTPPKKKSGKHPNLVAAEHGDNVTILSIENAVGSAIRSVILFNPYPANVEKMVSS